MPFLLQRVRFGSAQPWTRHFGGLHFGGLAFALRGFDLAVDRHAAAGREPFDFGLVVGQVAVGDDLNVGQTAAVVQFQKTEAPLAVAACPDPALQGSLSANGIRAAGIANRDFFHGMRPWAWCALANRLTLFSS